MQSSLIAITYRTQRNNCQHPSPCLQTPFCNTNLPEGLKKLNIPHNNQNPWLVSGAINQPLDLNMCTTFLHPIQDAQHSITGIPMLQHLQKASSTLMDPACIVLSDCTDPYCPHRYLSGIAIPPVIQSQLGFGLLHF